MDPIMSGNLNTDNTSNIFTNIYFYPHISIPSLDDADLKKKKKD